MNNNKIINLANPQYNNDAVNKQWLDFNLYDLADIIGPTSKEGN